MKLAIWIVVATLARGLAHGQQPATAGLAERVDAIAQTALARPLAGISIAVAQEGRVVFARGYGLANVEHGVPVAPETVFHVASISKNILAGAILQLADQGRLRLDEDVTKYVPEAPTQGRRVTVRQLLNHTSGIYSFTSLPDAEANERRNLTHEQVIALIRGRPFDFEPGMAWRYDNSAFYLAGMVVERVTGQDYGIYVRSRVFEPIGMDSARLCDAGMLVPRLASGYQAARDKLVPAALMDWKLPFAAGSICATATDLLKWQAALDEKRVLTAASLAAMRSPTTLADGTTIDYGLGTRLGSLEGHRVVGHTGGGGGFCGVLESFPDDRLTIVVLANRGDSATPAIHIATAIARLLLGLPATSPVRDLPVPREELDAIAGSTYDSDEGGVALREDGGKLHYRLVGRPIEGELTRQGPWAYAAEGGADIRFKVHGGRAEWSLVYRGGLLMDAMRRVR